MNKYDFDFKRIEDVLYEVLGIANPKDVMALKLQIHDSLKALSDAIEKKPIVGANEEEIMQKKELQKQALTKELDAIATEKDLETILRKCITIRYLTLLSLEVKVRPNDTYEAQNQKLSQRREIFAVSDLARTVPSIVDLMNRRDTLLNYIDIENRIVQFDKTENEILPSENPEEITYPDSKLMIQFRQKPSMFPESYRKCLEEAGIYAYDFGEVAYARFPNEEGRYTQQLTSKKMVGVIKKDEFGELRKYTVLMEDGFGDIPPEFFRDVLFSDMLLRNSRNNLNYLGSPERMPEDPWYGYRIQFDSIGLTEMLSAIYFENNPDRVSVQSNASRIKSVNDAMVLMQEKMEQAVRELFSDRTASSLGDDQRDV